MIGLDVLLDVGDQLVVGLAYDVLTARAMDYWHDAPLESVTAFSLRLSDHDDH
jgi:hypothetical protein